MSSTTQDEILRRRTFAIISHPDAGKTTMTEKLLLYGGAIHMAGTVKGRKANRHATSDWMEIEKQRGISVSSSVLQFDYQGCFVNILDTPGHQDFSEDTYRTLCAADAAVMMIDGAKGVEEQTQKLFKVCKNRHIPIFTFINKMDRAARSPFELMDELEKVLGIFAVPLNWPIGTDGDFYGVYNRLNDRIELFDSNKGDHGASTVEVTSLTLAEALASPLLPEAIKKQLQDDLELLDIAGDTLDLASVAKGGQTPLFFGSALTNFGVEFFLQQFLEMAPPPSAYASSNGIIKPTSEQFSGFIFKIQANMNPDHRDRIAFLRICSGKFERNMNVNLVRENKQIRLSQPQQFMAQDRNIVEEAFAGDIIGLFDAGQFRIGDTLVSGSPSFEFADIPTFPAEHFAEISPKDSMKRKQFLKGITQLAEEGAIQVYRPLNYGTETIIVGVVGILQFDVLTHRLKNEYGTEIRQTMLPYRFARWLVRADGGEVDIKELSLTSTTCRALDRDELPVILCESMWALDWATERNEGLLLEEIGQAHLTR